MKKRVVITLTAIFTVATAAILIILPDAQNNNKAGGETLTTGYLYTVKEYEGKVAVFDYGAASPAEILDCPLSSVPEEEAEKLKAGIDVATETELQQLIEAFD